MESIEKTYRHSFGKLALMFLGGLFIAYIIYASGELDYILLGMAGIIFIVSISYAASSVKISNDEIVTGSLLGSRSLRWTEISRVSMRGQSLRLHNRDEDVTLSLDSQLDGYPEILDIIFNKRPDLFEIENNVITRSVWGSIVAIGFGLLMMAISVAVFFTVDATGIILSVVFLYSVCS